MYALGKRRDAETKARDHEKEKDDRARATQLVSDGMWEPAVSAISKVLVCQGSKMNKVEYTKLVEQQRVAALHSIRQASSHSLSLSLPATIAETRDFRKDPHDEVLVRLALGMYVCKCMCIYDGDLHWYVYIYIYIYIYM